MVLTSGGDINPALPGLQNLDRQTRGAAKTEKSDSLTLLYPGNAQAAKADDPGAQQGSHMHVVQTLRDRKRKVGAHQRILRVATIDGISGECRVIAQVLHAVLTVPAIPIDAANPGDADAASQRQRCGSA